MESVVSEIKALISQKSKSETNSDIEIEIGVKNAASENQALELGRSVSYIVGAMLINEGRIVLIKEAKPSCRGKWYFPAGRLNKNESLEEGVKREVLEETGYEFQPTALICVDSLRLYNRWFRFTFVGRITGGKLKSLEEQDKESMEAKWFTKDEVLQLDLRAKDFLPLIDIALNWDKSKKQNPLFSSLPVRKAHDKTFVRVIMISRKCETDDEGAVMQVLVRKLANGVMNLPMVSPNNGDDYLFQTVKSLVTYRDNLLVPHKVHGLISIEHVGKPHGFADGVCFSILAEATEMQCSLPEDFVWHPIRNKQTYNKVIELIKCDGCIKEHFHH